MGDSVKNYVVDIIINNCATKLVPLCDLGGSYHSFFFRKHDDGIKIRIPHK